MGSGGDGPVCNGRAPMVTAHSMKPTRKLREFDTGVSRMQKAALGALKLALDERLGGILDAGIHTSWGTLREELSTHQVVTVVLPTSNGDTLKIRRGATPEPRHQEIYEALRMPSEVMKPVKTWVRAVVTE